jgi:dipeptidyl aminopeptidase/acylaminoacyl peptidase
MTGLTKSVRLLQAIVSCLVLASIVDGQGKPVPQRRRPVTVADDIAMTRLEATDYLNSSVVHFSPDGKRFVMVLRKGNLERKTNDFSLLLFQTADALRTPKAELLLTMSSSSIRDGITSLRWLPDNETLVFLGENPGEKSQVYMFNVNTKRLEKLTNHPTAIYDYGITEDGRGLAFRAASPWMEAEYPEQSSTKEVVVVGKSLHQILRGDYSEPEGQRVFWQTPGSPSHPIPTAAEYYIGWGQLFVSPGGRYIIFPAMVRDIPPAWSTYQNEQIQQRLAANLSKGSIPGIQQYLLCDTEKMSVSPLIGAPLIGIAPVHWAKDEKSVFLTSYLPLEAVDSGERKAREENKYPIEVRLPSREYRKVNKEDFPASGIQAPTLDLTVEQDLNTPPKVYVSDPKSHQKALLIDLNPQFNELSLGKVKTIKWKVGEIEVTGGLYFPPDYVPGQRYPLVIQTHGFNPDAFTMDGTPDEWTSGFAARPLATRGMLVLQAYAYKNKQDTDRVGSIRELGATPSEAFLKFSTLAYEGVVDFLDKEGLIDRNRIGIIGFSRMVCFVGYTLTHSKYQFAAASLVDGISCGYFQEIQQPDIAWDVNNIIGGAAPFGEGLKLWMKNSPGFNLDKVHTPVRLVALGNYSVWSTWEWYAGLTLQKKPVDFVLIPHGEHLGGMVSERVLEQQGLVDWFSFWLKGEQNPDPAKADQYARWRELREIQEQNNALDGR